MTMTTPLPLRNDTILGVCEAIGRDFGFNPLWLRLAFILPLFFAPTAAIAAYLGLGLVVGLIHWFARQAGRRSGRRVARRRRSRKTKRCRWPPNYPQFFGPGPLPIPLRARKCPNSSQNLTCLTKR
jgi:phage shock protein PspC (stress-responsive transcriptional regulator)